VGEKSPFMVDWAITEVCNLKCRHCRGMLSGDLTHDRAAQLVNEIAELKPAWVIIEGGEPLLRPDLFDILEALRHKSLEVHLISNGLLLDSEIISRLHTLGVKVMISIDGATSATYETIRTGSSFPKAVDAARRCARAGVLGAINCTVLKANYHEIPGIFDLAASVGAPKINFIGLKPCHNYPAELLTAAECGEAIRLACSSGKRTGIDFFFDEPFFGAVAQEWGLPAPQPAGDAGIVASGTNACIFGEYLFIEPSGDVKPCSFAPITVGNVTEKSLTDIWSEMLASPFFHRIREPSWRSGHCRDCRHLSQCKGCRSRTRVITGDWFASDPVCPLPRNEKQRRLK
jgi:radical SAM protein with 4Fe4S-binding SPASM domain